MPGCSVPLSLTSQLIRLTAPYELASPGYIIDSILPVEEEIRRFQATLGPRPSGFADGATSRSALVKLFVDALERRDTVRVARLVVNRSEFGYLVYPTSPNAAPPYRLSPDLVWMSRAASSHKGVTRLFARYGGRPLGYVGYSCADSVVREGGNEIWSGCSVSRRAPTGEVTTLRMFGPIIARDRRYKFLSLANGL